MVVSLVDNYQGEESHIIVASLTRSNSDQDIGFMSSPERLNVLLSRARDGLIIIGNSLTFKSSRTGQEMWKVFFQLIQERHSAFDGLPVKCQNHPANTALLRTPVEFEEKSPGGGCHERW